MVRWALTAVLLGLMVLPARATQDAWPALYDVAGVAADDVLNIRGAPSITAEIIGTLPPDRRRVEVIRPNDRESWGLVNVGERTGWVLLRYMARRPGQWQGAFPALASCFGTEPFWSLNIDGMTATYSTPGEALAGDVSARLASSARRDRHGLMARFGPRTMSAIVSSRACGDGMSDRAYGIAVDAILGDEVLSGCCSLSR